MAAPTFTAGSTLESPVKAPYGRHRLFHDRSPRIVRPDVAPQPGSETTESPSSPVSEPVDEGTMAPSDDWANITQGIWGVMRHSSDSATRQAATNLLQSLLQVDESEINQRFWNDHNAQRDNLRDQFARSPSTPSVDPVTWISSDNRDGTWTDEYGQSWLQEAYNSCAAFEDDNNLEIARAWEFAKSDWQLAMALIEDQYETKFGTTGWQAFRSQPAGGAS